MHQFLITLSTGDSGFSFFCSSLLLYHNCWCILTIPTVFRVPELSSLVLVYSKLGFVIMTGIWQPLDILSAGRLFIIGLANLWSEDLHLHVPSKSVELEDAPVHFWEFKRVLTIILYAPSINPFTFFFSFQVLNGDVENAICLHAFYYAIWRRFGALPERYNWQLQAPDVLFYPLRPELVESTYLLYQVQTFAFIF